MKQMCVFLTLLLVCTCSGTDGEMSRADAEPKPETLSYSIVRSFPHAPASFTQGLVYKDGFLYEGTGQKGQSELRKIDPANGRIMEQVKLPRDIFGEGITILDDKIYQLTWTSLKGFVYDPASLKLLRTFTFPLPIEGWGLTTDGKDLIWSDGSSTLYFIQPDTMKVKKRLTVTLQGRPIASINELEYIDGQIFANVWQTESIVRIDAQSGRINGLLDLSALTPSVYKGHADYVLNGIAYNPQNGHLIITGKMWPHFHEISIGGRTSK
ncbi:MAG: glutaminyl-peptide cyclotransferase [Acidobacteriota bacterium]|nr:glutaminyl-peptide cyclotransferase [Candidatus Aminicenantes bacterium]